MKPSGSVATRRSTQLTKQLHEKNVNVGEIRRVDDTHILVRNIDPATSATFRDIVTNQFPDWSMSPAPGEQNGYLLTMKPSVVADIRRNTMDQSLETITRRINALGLTEPTIAFTGRGDNEILVQLPGEGDPTRAKSVIQASGQLALNLVVDEQTYPSEAAALAAHGGVLPPGTEIVPGKSERSARQPSKQVFYILQSRSDRHRTRPAKRNISPSTNYPGPISSGFQAFHRGGGRFGPFTETNIGHRMAIVLDHQVYSAPDDQRPHRRFRHDRIFFTQETAQDLVLVLARRRASGLDQISRRAHRGPSLGADSIREGVRASIGSLIVVMIFLVIYYRLSGVNAVVALMLNLVILIAFMAYAGAVLTLPGIAGVILTIGMGVDSNVLVFERIREELRNGKAPLPPCPRLRSRISDDHRHARDHDRFGRLSLSCSARARCEASPSPWS